MRLFSTAALFVAMSIHATPLDYDQLSKVSNQELARIVDRDNWQLRFQFAHVQALNAYASSRGWKRPPQLALCFKRDIAELPPLPDFKPTVKDGKMPNFDAELSEYVKQVALLYRKAYHNFEEFNESSLNSCQY